MGCSTGGTNVAQNYMASCKYLLRRNVFMTTGSPECDAVTALHLLTV